VRLWHAFFCIFVRKDIAPPERRGALSSVWSKCQWVSMTHFTGALPRPSRVCGLQLQRLEMSQCCSSALYLTRTADFLVSATGRLDSKKHSLSQPTFEQLSPKIAISLAKRSVPSSQS
jgi:hypothetical protein